LKVKTPEWLGKEGTERAVADVDSGRMFLITAHADSHPRVLVVGRPSRKKAETFINVPVSAELRTRLGERITGSLAMGTAALLEWALDEIEKQKVSLSAEPMK
jgi:hypothetical protein